MRRGGSESGLHFLKDFLQCQKYFYWSYVRRLKPKYTAPALLYGTALHEALAEWYKGVREGQQTHERVNRALKTFDAEMEGCRTDYMYDDTWESDRQKGIDTLRQYALTYPYELWDVLEIERLYEYEFEPGYKFTGRVDAVVQEGTRTYIVDHKTTGWSIANLIKSFNVADQATGYMLLWNMNNPDRPADGVIYNIIKYYRGKLEFKRHTVLKANADIERFRLDMYALIQDIMDKVANADNPAVRWIQNTNNCYSFNRECAYMDLCRGANFEGLIGTKYKQETDDA